MNQYLAMIGDLKGSRHIADRAQAQLQIKKALEEINHSYPECITSKLTLTLGDEFQALLSPCPRLMQMLDELAMLLKDFPFRMGLGYGEISTAIDSNISIGADGQAYWQARDAIEYVHDNNAGGKVKTHICGFGPQKDELLNALFEASDTIKHGWTNLQTDTFHHMLRQGIYTQNFEQNIFAQAIGISQSSLTKRLSAGNIKLYLKIRGLIAKSIREWQHED
ncbi:MAG: hypothetical protein GX781_08835 [Clostridiales bacterium]|nr:hypothetical protein [Clostridiales bacterium]